MCSGRGRDILVHTVRMDEETKKLQEASFESQVATRRCSDRKYINNISLSSITMLLVSSVFVSHTIFIHPREFLFVASDWLVRCTTIVASRESAHPITLLSFWTGRRRILIDRRGSGHQRRPFGFVVELFFPRIYVKC